MHEGMLTIAARATKEPSVETQVVNEVKTAVDNTTDIVQQVMKKLPVFATRLAMAILVIIVGFIILKLGKFIISKMVFRRNNRKQRSTQRGDTARSIASSIYSYIIFFVMLIIVLNIFGVDATSILATAGVAGVAIAFGAQTLVKDIISGLFIWGEGSISVGDFVSINDLEGTVESISIRTTVLRNFNGNIYTIPNGDIRTMTNMSRGFKRAIVEVRCPYEEKLDRIRSILRDEMVRAAEEINGIDTVPDILSVSAFETDAMILQIAVQCPVGQHWRIEREIRTRVKDRFDREGIVMPHYTAPRIKQEE